MFCPGLIHYFVVWLTAFYVSFTSPHSHLPKPILSAAFLKTAVRFTHRKRLTTRVGLSGNPCFVMKASTFHRLSFRWRVRLIFESTRIIKSIENSIFPGSIGEFRDQRLQSAGLVRHIIAAP